MIIPHEETPWQDSDVKAREECRVTSHDGQRVKI